MTPEQHEQDVALAKAVHDAESALNLVLGEASAHGLDAEASTIDEHAIGRGRCTLVLATVRRPL